MNQIHALENSIQHYDWGNTTFIPQLLQRKNSTNRPYAELWVGAHRSAPSKLRLGARQHNLYELIQADPTRWVGERCRTRFGAKLPFLLKVLSAEKGLSIQAHPNLQQAQAGYAAEERRQIAHTDAQRTYKDQSHKPELMCALTPFWAMCGFRSPQEIATTFQSAHFATLHPYLKGDYDISHLLPLLLRLNDDADVRDGLIAAALDYIAQQFPHLIQSAHMTTPPPSLSSREIAYWWVQRLRQIFPNDIGVFAPLYLNTFMLKPYHGLFIGAQTVHAYLNGNGVEIMANSDNVLRGGLTTKYINTAELLSIVDFKQSLFRLDTMHKYATCTHFQTPAAEFTLYFYHLSQSKAHINTVSAPKIVLCTRGSATLRAAHDQIAIAQGETYFIEPTLSRFSIDGDADIFLATTNI